MGSPLKEEDQALKSYAKLWKKTTSSPALPSIIGIKNQPKQWVYTYGYSQSNHFSMSFNSIWEDEKVYDPNDDLTWQYSTVNSRSIGPQNATVRCSKSAWRLWFRPTSQHPTVVFWGPMTLSNVMGLQNLHAIVMYHLCTLFICDMVKIRRDESFACGP